MLLVFISFSSPALEASVKPKTKKERLKEMFPALCRANDPAPDVCGFILHMNLYFCMISLTILALLQVKMDF